MDLSFKYYKTTLLVSVLLVLATLIDYLLIDFVIPLLEYFHLKPQVLRAPGNAAIILIILGLYNSYLWKWPFFKLLVKVPNMQGRYQGVIKYVFQGAPGEKMCFFEISQTASKIKVHAYFNNDNNEFTSSKSLVEEIMEEEGFYNIYLFYLNSGTVGSGILDCHEGANSFRFIPETDGVPKRLYGHYFTNRTIQTRGTIEVQYISDKLLGHF